MFAFFWKLAPISNYLPEISSWTSHSISILICQNPDAPTQISFQSSPSHQMAPKTWVILVFLSSHFPCSINHWILSILPWQYILNIHCSSPSLSLPHFKSPNPLPSLLQKLSNRYLLEEVIKKLWLPVNLPAGPRQLEAPHPLPCPWNMCPLVFPTSRSCSKDKPWNRNVVLRLSEQCTWLNPGGASL